MLPVGNRVRSREDFQRVFRGGHTAGTRNLIVYAASDPQSHAPRVGFVVSKAVGNAVTRNRVKRRLRSIVHARLDVLRSGLYVVRALPQAARADFVRLERDFDYCLRKVFRGWP